MVEFKEPAAEKLKKLYLEIKPDIENRIENFQEIWEEGNDERVFKELVFCIFTPQSQARSCWDAVQYLDREGYLLNADKETLIENIEGVRFKYKKAGYVVEAREKFIESNRSLKSILSKFEDESEAREYVVDEVKGLGYKEGTHFLRNIGKSRNLAILDRHIIRNLNRIDIIDEVPKTLTHRRYLDIEEKMQNFAEEIQIPMSHLDLLLWYREAGEVFK